MADETVVIQMDKQFDNCRWIKGPKKFPFTHPLKSPPLVKANGWREVSKNNTCLVGAKHTE